MDRNKILIVTHEMDPYLVISSAAELIRSLPKPLQDMELDVRILMPRFGTINERRHRLHEVVRLSGINIVVDDEDYPLIIKVASLPGARLQVYFLDNDEFFRRKSVFEDRKTEEFHEDNDDRVIFFCQGVLETVKKFGWPPNVIHCSGWFSSLIPLFLKKVYYDEPVFAHSKIIYSVYPNEFDGQLGDKFADKIKISDQITDEDVAVFKSGDNHSLNVGGMKYADKVIIDETIEQEYKDDINENHIVISGEEISPESIVNVYQELIEED